MFNYFKNIGFGLMLLSIALSISNENLIGVICIGFILYASGCSEEMVK